MIDPASLLNDLPGRLYQHSLRQRQPLKWLTGFISVLSAILRDLVLGQLLLRATSLVYTTLLSIVPMLALTFSLSKAFGVHGQIEPALQSFLEPLGERGTDISNQIVGFINNMHVGVLGSVGLAMLFFTAISTILKIESAINTIWHVRQLRPISHRITGYLSILLLGPVIVFSSLGLNAAAASSTLVQTLIAIEPFGELAILAGKLLPYLLIIALFLLLYLYMPNTRVNFIPALLSALVAGIAWQSAGWGFARFVATSTQYDAIYSGFAILILFMLWIYVSWVVVLLGASVGLYLQHPEYIAVGAGEAHLSDEDRTQLGLALMQAVAARHLQGGTPPSTQELADRFLTPATVVDELLQALSDGGLLAASAQEQYTTWLPARDIGTISVWQTLDIIRSSGTRPLAEIPPGSASQAYLEAQARMAETLSAISFRELLLNDSRLPEAGIRPGWLAARPPAVPQPPAEPSLSAAIVPASGTAAAAPSMSSAAVRSPAWPVAPAPSSPPAAAGLASHTPSSPLQTTSAPAVPTSAAAAVPAIQTGVLPPPVARPPDLSTTADTEKTMADTEKSARPKDNH